MLYSDRKIHLIKKKLNHKQMSSTSKSVGHTFDEKLEALFKHQEKVAIDPYKPENRIITVFLKGTSH